MEKAEKVLIIPDMHGRTFWKEAVKDREDWRIVFLGDYLDPYPYEDITYRSAIDNFIKIVNFKKEHNKNVTLLLGNHDCTYAFPNGKNICYCRADKGNYQEISNIFTENYSLFSIALELEVGGKQFVFSHAPILDTWYGMQYENDNKRTKVVERLNEDYLNMTDKFMDALSEVDWYKGSYSNIGSVVWADVRALSLDEQPLALPNDYAIFGHTQLMKDPIILDDFACLDCRRAFILNEDGKITELDGKEVPKAKLQKN